MQNESLITSLTAYKWTKWALIFGMANLLARANGLVAEPVQSVRNETIKKQEEPKGRREIVRI